MFYFQEYIDEKFCMAHYESIVVFGDNLIEKGKAGQAIIRDEGNAFGVPTKRLPSMDINSFFSDQKDEYDIVKSKLIYLWEQHLLGRNIILPSNPIGSGLANLKEKSPVIFKLVSRFYSSALHSTKIEEIDLEILSYIAGFKVVDYEISINKKEIRYGNPDLQKDGFVLVEQYLALQNHPQNTPQMCENCLFYREETPNVCIPNGKEHDRWGIKVCSMFKKNTTRDDSFE